MLNTLGNRSSRDFLAFTAINGINFLFSYFSIAIISKRYSETAISQYSIILIFWFIAQLLDFGLAHTIQNKGVVFKNKYGEAISNDTFYRSIRFLLYLFITLIFFTPFLDKPVIIGLLLGLSNQLIIVYMSVYNININMIRFAVIYLLLNVCKLVVLELGNLSFYNALLAWVILNLIVLYYFVKNCKRLSNADIKFKLFNRWTYKYRIDQWVLAILNIGIWSADRLVLYIMGDEYNLTSYTIAFTAAGLTAVLVQPLYKFFISSFRHRVEFEKNELGSFRLLVDIILVVFVGLQYAIGDYIFLYWLGSVNDEIMINYLSLILIGFLVSRTWFISGENQLLDTTGVYNKILFLSFIIGLLVVGASVYLKLSILFAMWLTYSLVVNAWDIYRTLKKKKNLNLIILTYALLIILICNIIVGSKIGAVFISLISFILATYTWKTQVISRS